MTFVLRIAFGLVEKLSDYEEMKNDIYCAKFAGKNSVEGSRRKPVSQVFQNSLHESNISTL